MLILPAEQSEGLNPVRRFGMIRVEDQVFGGALELLFSRHNWHTPKFVGPAAAWMIQWWRQV